MHRNSVILFFGIFLRITLLQGDFQPEEYHNSNNGQFKYAVKELYKLNFVGNETVLDIGSGDGKVSTYIARHCIPQGKLIGIDNNCSMVEFAVSHSTAMNLFIYQADIVEYVIPEFFDVIVSFSTLHWVAEYQKAIENIAVSLKKNGKILLYHAVGLDPLEPIIVELLKKEEWNIYKQNYTTFLHAPSLLHVVDAVAKAGLSIESLKVKKNGEWMPLEMMKQNLLSLALFDFIPADKRIEFCNEVLQNFIREYPLNEKGEVYDWLLVVVMVLKK